MANEPRPAHPRAWSSHGEARRNSGNFTRGSQLVGHQLSMWWRGARVPLMLFTGLLVLLVWVKLSFSLGEYEWQMIGQRLLASLWDYLGFSEMKRVNITLRNGMIYQTYMGYVPFVPDVQIAWAKLINAFTGSFILSGLSAAIFSWWYVPWARQRGEKILADHHERGVELVDYEDLKKMLVRNNNAKLKVRARELYPDLTAAEVADLPFEERKRAGLIEPYTIATLPFPYGFEQSHIMAVGTTGTGKTTVLRQLVAQAIERRDRCVIFDLTGHYVEAFYTEGRDHILNLNDKRCESWSVFNDCDTQSEFVSAAAALIPADHGSDGGFWERAARTLFVEMCVKLKSLGLTSNKALSDELMKASLKHIYSRLKGTVADPLTSPDASKMAQSIRAVLNSNGESLRFLPEGGAPFSIKEWIKRDDGKASILFITAQYVHLDMSKSLLTLWMNIAINTMMTLKHTRILRTWFIFDELAALHQLPALERGMQTARSFGGAFVLGLHNFAGLRKAYGDDGAQNIVSLANTSLMLRVKDRETAQECSNLIGYRKVRTMDESYSYGAHQTRDASTISPTTKEEALVIADDITSLPNLHGYIRFPEKFPSTLVSIPYVAFPPIAEGFIPADPPPIYALADDDEEEFAEEGSGQDIAGKLPEDSDHIAQSQSNVAVSYHNEANAQKTVSGTADQLQFTTGRPQEAVGNAAAISGSSRRQVDYLFEPRADSLEARTQQSSEQQRPNRFFRQPVPDKDVASETRQAANKGRQANTHEAEESASGKLAKREAQMDFTLPDEKHSGQSDPSLDADFEI